MHPIFPSESERLSVHSIVEDLLGERIEALAGWIQELDANVRTLSAAGDEQALKELRKALDAWSKRDPKFEEKLTERVDVLADRIATLSSAVNTTAAAHAGNDGEIATLRRELEQATATFAELRDVRPESKRIDSDELKRMVEKVSAGQPDIGDKPVRDLREKIANLGERIDTLAKTVATTAAGLAGREGEIACLRRSLEDETARVERTVDELREAVSSSQAGAVEAQLEALERHVGALGAKEEETAALRGRLQQEAARSEAEAAELRGALAFLSSQVSALQASTSDGSELASVEGRIAGIDCRISELAGTVDSLAQRVPDLARLSAEMDSLAEGLTESWTAADERSTAQDSRTDTLERALLDAVERVSAVESDREERDRELVRTREEWSEERTWVRERLDALVNEISDTRAAAEIEARLGQLGERLAGLERARANDDGLVERLEARIEDVAARTIAIPPSEDEQLRELLVAFADRIEGMERNLTHRMDAVERDAAQVPPVTASADGDGRFLLELRTLELGLQQAEAQAHTSREEILLQLERIASRLDWRLQRLEAEEEPAYHETPAEPVLGQVVPIRSGADT